MTVLARLALCALASLPAASEAAAANWPEGLAHIVIDPEGGNLTSANLALRLAPFVMLEGTACRTAAMPTAASPAPISSAIIAYGDDQACNEATPLALLQLYVEAADPGDITRLKDALIVGLPKPCFAGNLPNDPRRHAPLRHEIAWRQQQGRIVTLVQESGAPRAAAVAMFIANLQPGPGVTGSYERLRADYVAGLPATCR